MWTDLIRGKTWETKLYTAPDPLDTFVTKSAVPISHMMKMDERKKSKGS